MAKPNGKGSTAKLPKAPTGIQGLDEITGGGFPRAGRRWSAAPRAAARRCWRWSSWCAAPSSTASRACSWRSRRRPTSWPRTSASLGFDLDKLTDAEEAASSTTSHVERSEIEETGEYDLDGLFIRLGYAIDSIGAKRVVLDTIETLFGGLVEPGDPARRAAAAVPLAQGQGRHRRSSPRERGDGTLTRHGLEEYVSDCVILLDHRVTDQVSTRRLRVVKYRGTAHGTNEYPFLIDEDGFSVLPDHVGRASSTRRPTSGSRPASRAGRDARRRRRLPRQQRPASAARRAPARAAWPRTSPTRACRRGERCLYFAFEESREPDRAQHALDRRSTCGPGSRRACSSSSPGGRPRRPGDAPGDRCTGVIREFQPRMVVVDPISNLADAGILRDAIADADAADRFPEERSRSPRVFTSLTAGGRADGGDGGRHLVADRHLAAAARHRAGRRAQPRPLRAQVARHGALQSDPRVPADAARHRPARRLRRARTAC